VPSTLQNNRRAWATACVFGSAARLLWKLSRTSPCRCAQFNDDAQPALTPSCAIFRSTANHVCSLRAVLRSPSAINPSCCGDATLQARRVPSPCIWASPTSALRRVWFLRFPLLESQAASQHMPQQPRLHPTQPRASPALRISPTQHSRTRPCRACRENRLWWAARLTLISVSVSVSVSVCRCSPVYLYVALRRCVISRVHDLTRVQQHQAALESRDQLEAHCAGVLVGEQQARRRTA
jgi:hypothetical protein